MIPSTSSASVDVLPGIPALGDYLPGFEDEAWFGLGTAAGTPPEIVGELNRTINEALSDPQFRSQLITIGAEPTPMNVAKLKKFTSEEAAKIDKIMKFAHIGTQ